MKLKKSLKLLKKKKQGKEILAALKVLASLIQSENEKDVRTKSNVSITKIPYFTPHS